MFFSLLRLLAVILAVGAVAWAAYANRGTPWAAAALALVSGGAIAAWWIRSGRRRDGVMHDPSVSTLVFPPESKFQQSVLPPR